MTGTDIYMKTDATKNAPFAAMGFSGKKSTPDFHFVFKTMDARNDYICKYENNIRAYNKAKEDRKDKRMAPTTLKAGDILYASWGYEQTNIDFYEVTKVIGKRTVEIREIACEVIDPEFDRGHKIPVPGKFIGKPEKKVVRNGDTISITSYASAYRYDGSPKYFSTYA